MNAKPNVLVRVTMLAALIASCSDQVSDPTAPTSRPSPSPSAALVDVSGLWNWSNEDLLTMPEFVAVMFGIPPEGPITHIRCESSGTMVLTQVGSSFTFTDWRKVAPPSTDAATRMSHAPLAVPDEKLT